jgi:hypothetical protein
MGKDDGGKYEISKDQLARFREAIDNGLVDHIDIKARITVKGGDVFTENKLLGFISKNLCVSALDFATGPWTSSIT